MTKILFQAYVVDRLLHILLNEKCLCENQLDSLIRLANDWDDVQSEGGLTDETHEELFSIDLPAPILFPSNRKIQYSDIMNGQEFLHSYREFVVKEIRRLNTLLDQVSE